MLLSISVLQFCFTPESFESFANAFGKRYASPAEEAQRRANFNRFQLQVAVQNAAFHAGNSSWWASLSHIADWSDEERAKLRGRRAPSVASPTVAPLASPVGGALPDSFDWRSKGVVTPIKDQGGCGSCWAFASTETMESHFAIASGQLLELAPQTYVNCAPNPQHCGGTGGCEGSIPELAFNFTAAHGIALEVDLPYRGRDHACNKYVPAVTCGGYSKLPANDATALETALATVGPLAVNVAAMPWEIYGGGIFDGGCGAGKSCDLDHVVQAVGYAKDYWSEHRTFEP